MFVCGTAAGVSLVNSMPVIMLTGGHKIIIDVNTTKTLQRTVQDDDIILGIVAALLRNARNLFIEFFTFSKSADEEDVISKLLNRQSDPNLQFYN